jgi:hypothetical protein
MDKTLLSIYKLPFLISITLSIALLAVGTVKQPLQITAVFLASFAGMFVLDLEYFIDAYFVDAKTDFSRTLVGFVGHMDFGNALKFVHYHKEDIKDNSLSSALFQIVLALLSVFVLYSTTSVFAKALVIAVFAQSIYRLFEYYFKNRTDDWFWVFAKKPSKPAVQVYMFVMLVVFSFCLYIF